MSPEKRAPIVLTPSKGMRRELTNLYARRSAIDTLIQSLQVYERSVPVKRADERKRKSA